MHVLAMAYIMRKGMAIRMSQALRPTTELASATTPEAAVIRQETRNRTIWSCYAMDRLFSCGKDRPTVFLATEMRIPLPLNEPDFAFGEIKEKRRYLNSEATEDDPSYGHRDLHHRFAIILQGVDIWATLSKWSADGEGRKYRDLDDCPWRHTSPWNKICCDLEVWYGQLQERLRYSPKMLTAQLHQDNPETFAYINLLYYLW